MENLTLTEATSMGKRALRGFKIVKHNLDSSAWSIYVMTKENVDSAMHDVGRNYIFMMCRRFLNLWN